MSKTKNILFNDGEGLSHADFNKVRDLAHLHFTDQMLYDRLATGSPGNPFIEQNAGIILPANIDYDAQNDAQDYCWVMGPTAGHVCLTGLAWEVVPGTVAQYIGTVYPNAADDYDLLLYSVNDAELTGTLDTNVGGGADRIDIIEIKLEKEDDTPTSVDFKDAITGALTTSSVDKRRGVKATVQVVKGTPGAGAPSVSAGFVPLMYITIDVTDASLSEESAVWPLGKLKVSGQSTFIPTASGGWARGAAGQWEATAGSDVAFVPLTPTSVFSRILAVKMFLDDGTGWDEVSFGRWNGWDGYTALYDVTSDWSGAAATKVYRFELNTEDAATGLLHGPLWGNGRRTRHQPALAGTTSPGQDIAVIKLEPQTAAGRAFDPAVAYLEL